MLFIIYWRLWEAQHLAAEKFATFYEGEEEHLFWTFRYLGEVETMCKAFIHYILHIVRARSTLAYKFVAVMWRMI